MVLFTRRDLIAIAVIAFLILTGLGIRLGLSMQDQPDDIKVIRNAVNPPSILNDPDSLSYTENRSLSLIDVNTAGHEELEQLPMIGHSRALAIIAYREEHGQFKSIEELTNVSGIGPGIFQKIKSNITVQQTETGNTESK